MPANSSNSSVPYPIPSLFASRKLFVGFSPKGLSDSDISISPTSTLETKHFSSKNHHQKVKVEVAPIGLALVDVLTNDASNHNRLYLFGSQLKFQLPSSSPPPPPPPQSPIEFGVKTKDSQLARQPMSLPPPPPADPSSPPEFLAGMELSEEYTCVISHGPNPKTTHIFDNCVVESCGGKLGFVALGEESGFLSCCHACKQNLSQGRDIFMYRGEKAFCSEECRRREIMLDDAEEKYTQDLSELL